MNTRLFKILFIVAGLFVLSTVAFAHGISDADKAAMLEGGNLRYIWLGATHMLSGYDHLLFLFGVIFFLKNSKDIFKFVTVFTLGHSITLILATFLSIRINYYIIDAVIALSVIYKGFDNVQGFQHYFGMKKSPNLLLMVLLFGLIHGFGLSTRLQQLPLGEQSTEMLLRIVSFNIGVEVGQVLALIGMLIVINVLRRLKNFKGYSIVFNHLIIFLGFLLLLMQLHGYLHVKAPDELGFAKKTHKHIYEDMEIDAMNGYQLN